MVRIFMFPVLLLFLDLFLYFLYPDEREFYNHFIAYDIGFILVILIFILIGFLFSRVGRLI